MALMKMPCAVGTGGGGDYSILEKYTNYYQSGDYGASHLLSDLAGKKVLCLIYSSSSGTYLNNTFFDGATTNDGSTITKLDNFHPTSDYNVAGTIYQIDVKTNACTVSQTNSGYCMVLDAS